MKFLVDMALSPDLARWLRDNTHDALHASEMALSRAADSEILQIAIAQQRIVVTADLDFPRLLASIGADGPGLVLLRGGNFSEAESRECLERVLAVVPEDDLRKSLLRASAGCGCLWKTLRRPLKINRLYPLGKGQFSTGSSRG